MSEPWRVGWSAARQRAYDALVEHFGSPLLNTSKIDLHRAIVRILDGADPSPIDLAVICSDSKPT